MKIRPPRHIVWSTDEIDLSDPFQRRWYVKQVILHGRTEDVAKLDLHDVAEVIDDPSIPPEVRKLWKRLLERRGIC